ncbi:hypothetical protein RUND412_004934 [Rhizina undulata]
MPLTDLPDSNNPSPFSTDSPDTLFLLTSLTSGSSAIITATSRLEHLLKSHKIEFQAVDVATDEKAKSLWGRRGKGKRLPGVVKDGLVLGNFEDLDEWNEYGELKQNLGLVPAAPSVTAPADKDEVSSLAGSISTTDAMVTAKPNIASTRPTSSASMASVASAQSLAIAAAAAGQNLRRTPSAGVKSAVASVEGKEPTPSIKSSKSNAELESAKPDRDDDDKAKHEKKPSASSSKYSTPTIAPPPTATPKETEEKEEKETPADKAGAEPKSSKDREVKFAAEVTEKAISVRTDDDEDSEAAGEDGKGAEEKKEKDKKKVSAMTTPPS